jgi:hypothetical protein
LKSHHRHFRLTDDELKLKRGKHKWFENEHAFALNLLAQDKMIEDAGELRRVNERQLPELARSCLREEKVP